MRWYKWEEEKKIQKKNNNFSISCSAKTAFRDKSINPASDLGFKMGDFSAFANLDLSTAAR